MKWANKYFGTRIVDTEFSMQSLHHYTLFTTKTNEQTKIRSDEMTTAMATVSRSYRWKCIEEKEPKTTMTCFSFIDNWHINLLLYLPSKNLASPTISFYFIFSFFHSFFRPLCIMFVLSNAPFFRTQQAIHSEP